MKIDSNNPNADYESQLKELRKKHAERIETLKDQQEKEVETSKANHAQQIADQTEQINKRLKAGSKNAEASIKNTQSVADQANIQIEKKLHEDIEAKQKSYKNQVDVLDREQIQLKDQRERIAAQNKTIINALNLNNETQKQAITDQAEQNIRQLNARADSVFKVKNEEIVKAGEQHEANMKQLQDQNKLELEKVQKHNIEAKAKIEEEGNKEIDQKQIFYTQRQKSLYENAKNQEDKLLRENDFRLVQLSKNADNKFVQQNEAEKRRAEIMEHENHGIQDNIQQEGKQKIEKLNVNAKSELERNTLENEKMLQQADAESKKKFAQLQARYKNLQAEEERNSQIMLNRERELTNAQLIDKKNQRAKNLGEIENQLNTRLSELQQQNKNQISKMIAESKTNIPLGQDPFYGIRSLNPQITESDSHYMVKVNVPETEKNNVDVVVGNDSVKVYLNRKFNGKTETPEGWHNSTNSMESHVEQIYLPMKIRPNKVIKKWDNNTIEVFIPKVVDPLGNTPIPAHKEKTHGTAESLRVVDNNLDKTIEKTDFKETPVSEAKHGVPPAKA